LPGYQSTLRNKIDYLEQLVELQREKGVAEDPIVYIRYFGETIGNDPLGRLEQDKNSRSNMTLFKTWCQRIEAEGDLEVYSFPGLEVQTEGQASWLTSPSSWNAEYLVVLAGWLGTMNSASGGMPQVQHAVPEVSGDVRGMVLGTYTS
jgi:hypothetical protein